MKDFDCPESVFDYNCFMGGVDRGDELRQYYHVRVKSCRSYEYIFWFLFEFKYVFLIPIFLVDIQNIHIIRHIYHLDWS